MRKIIAFLLISVCFCKCTSNDARDVVSTSLAGNLILEIPKEMYLVERKGIDGYVAYIIDEKKDTVHVEYGNRGIIYSLRSESPPVFPLSQKESMAKASGKEPSPDDVLFSEYADEDREENIFDKNYYMYDTINSIVVKLVQPKRIGNGISGLFIPKLKDGKSLSIYARNLDSSANQNLLKIFTSIRYKG
jgi:hypothetical protein